MDREARAPAPLAIIGAPSSAGAYAPGQEGAPAALRAAGLAERLSARGIPVRDLGDVPGFRWRVDRANPRAMNAGAAAAVARATANQVSAAMATGGAVLVLGGDCTVELGTVAGALRESERIGLVYVDLDTDLHTPASTTDGALDWMGVAHLLGIDGALPELAELGPRVPMLRPEQVHFFGTGNSEPIERQRIQELGIAQTRVDDVAADPEGAARAVVDGWARRFDRLLIHLDVDVLDFAHTPLAENTRRNTGLRFEPLIAALRVLLQAPNWAALTICELNPDHGESDGSTASMFAEALSDALAGSPRWRGT
ncbi:MAG TPA: arginase family protein [Longimicrobium sp.]|nr:arginase family protein [Longimicrobium sp.]